MKKIIFIAFFAVLFASCTDNDNDNQTFHYEILPIEEATIPSSFEWNETYDITLKFNLPNGCHHFHSLYYKYDDNERIVAVYSIVENNVACTEALIQKEHTFQVKATQEDAYTFKIWKGLDDNDDDIFDEVIVPVTGTPNQQ
jgi:hypothetical protein